MKDDMTPILYVKVISKYKYKKKTQYKTKTLKILVDSGSSSSVVSAQGILDNKTYKSSRTKWKTTAGKFITDKKVDLTLKCLNCLKQQW